MEMGLTIPNHGCLEKWAKQGVLLLNSALTVRDGLANSHKNKGWEKVTDRIVALLNERPEPIIFLLWGNDAKKKEELITSPQHIILTAAHPSPLSASRGFMGCGHFAKVNNILKAMQENWGADGKKSIEFIQNMAPNDVVKEFMSEDVFDFRYIYDMEWWTCYIWGYNSWYYLYCLLLF